MNPKPHAAPLPDEFLSALTAEFTDDQTVGMLLAGSHARGEATAYSDVDLVRFARVQPETEAGRYLLAYRAEWLVSVSTTTLTTKESELARPETAIWAVPGLRQARILLDREGQIAALLQKAHAFQWAPLQPAADAYASYELMGLAEEVHKVLGALAYGNEPTAAYGIWGLVLGLPRAVAVQRGLLIPTENAYLRLVPAAIGDDSAWARAFAVAAGLVAAPAAASPVIVRAMAALRLYRETASLLESVVQPDHAPIIAGALARIRMSGLTKQGT
jgi:hypothetical protein